MTADVVGALDVGGAHVSAGRVRLSAAEVEPEGRLRAEFAGEGSLLERILDAARSVATPQTHRFGVAVPGPFDYATGVCLVSHKLPGLYGVNLRNEFSLALGLPGGAVSFLNDAEAFLLGESWAGAARGHGRVLGITLGTGLGSAFLEGGRIVRSGPGVPADGALYTQTFRGAPVEETISSAGLLARYGTDAGDVEQIAERASTGERRARLVFEELGADLAEFLGPAVRSFAPTCLVVGGSIAYAWELLEPGLASLRGPDRRLVVARAASIDDAALLGAAKYAAEQP
jgi:glucokinase